jgi:hypothetical protein
VEKSRSSEEPFLKVYLPEDVKLLFEMDDLESMSTGDIDSALIESQRSDSTTDLVHEVDEKPVPTLDQEWQLLEKTAQESILKYVSVWCGNDALIAKHLKLATA